MQTTALEVLVGCYTPPMGSGDGISTALVTGAVLTGTNVTGANVTGAAGEGTVASPSFLAVHPTLPVVYAVAELEEGRLVTLRREAGGPLRVVDDRPTLGAEPCHVALSPDARWIAVANYKSGSLAITALGDDGVPTGDTKLMRHTGSGPIADRQASPHCHQVTFDGMLLTVTDLGADRIRRYRLQDGDWVAGDDVVLTAGTGPRHQVIDGDTRYVVGELRGTVTAFRVGADGAWMELGSAPTTAFTGTSLPSHLILHDGHLYVGNRGADTVGVLRLDDGRPTFIGETPTGGAWPRHFALVGNSHVGNALVVANQLSNELTILDLHAASPLPSAATGRLATGSPTCILPI